MTFWEFATEDFAALWLTPGVDRFLPPLDYTSRFTHRNEFDRHHRDLQAAQDSDNDLQRALQDLRTPDRRIDLRATRIGTAEPLRLAGAVAADRAVLVVQHRVPVVTVSTLNPARLPSAITGHLPELPPGAQRAASFHAADIAPDAGRPDIYDAGAFTPREHYQRLVGAATARGRIVCTNSDGQSRSTAQWFDVEDDGRYLRTGDSRVTVAPAGTLDLALAFGRLVTVAPRR